MDSGVRTDHGGEPLPENVSYEHCWEVPGIYVVRMSWEKYLAYKEFLRGHQEMEVKISKTQ